MVPGAESLDEIPPGAEGLFVLLAASSRPPRALRNEATLTMAPSPKAQTSMQSIRRRQTFLVIEDNSDDEALIARAFADSGILASLAVAHDGEEAIQWLKANTDVSFLLLDLNLPRMNGFEVLQAVRADAKLRQLPVIVFTSSNAHKDVDRAYRLGATSYVQKPAQYADFAATIQSILQYWLRTNQTVRQGL